MKDGLMDIFRKKTDFLILVKIMMLVMNKQSFHTFKCEMTKMIHEMKRKMHEMLQIDKKKKHIL